MPELSPGLDPDTTTVIGSDVTTRHNHPSVLVSGLFPFNYESNEKRKTFKQDGL